MQPLPVPDRRRRHRAQTSSTLRPSASTSSGCSRPIRSSRSPTRTRARSSRICRALDGLPLALELAAARVRTLGAEGTAARLGERLSLLSRGARDLPERQRSLRATLDWSVQLLDADAVRVLGALGAFSGGASLEAVEDVARGSDVPSALEDLLDAALVTRSGGATGEPRFGDARDSPRVRDGAPREVGRGACAARPASRAGFSRWWKATGRTGSGTWMRRGSIGSSSSTTTTGRALEHARARRRRRT